MAATHFLTKAGTISCLYVKDLNVSINSDMFFFFPSYQRRNIQSTIVGWNTMQMTTWSLRRRRFVKPGVPPCLLSYRPWRYLGMVVVDVFLVLKKQLKSTLSSLLCKVIRWTRGFLSLCRPQVELPRTLLQRQLEERIRVLEQEEVELISVPVPDFDDGDPADIVHDFQRVRQLSTQ